MKKAKYIMLVTTAVLVFAAGAFAQAPSAPAAVKADSAAATTQQIAKPSQQSQNKQASINRPTKKTNWSKIKTMFE